VNNLEEIYNESSLLDSQNVEVNLLLGDISHYLFNLDNNKYYQLAINHYEKAINLAPDDYRGYWFLAQHYALSYEITKSVIYFLKAQNLLTGNGPSEFWEDYAFATLKVKMPSHCIHAMDKAKEILGKQSVCETAYGSKMRSLFAPGNKASAYNYNDIWEVSFNDFISLVCRPLGIKLLVDPTWNIDFFDYKGYYSMITVGPPAKKIKKGIKNDYSISIIMKTKKDGDDLDSLLDKITSKYKFRTKTEFSDKYPATISYEVKEAGKHKNNCRFVVGLCREKPEYPGYMLERPMAIPIEKSDELEYNHYFLYPPGSLKDRFDGTIYYIIILDADKDLYPKALDDLKSLFENQLIIE
jgi:hypothetical protein